MNNETKTENLRTENYVADKQSTANVQVENGEEFVAVTSDADGKLAGIASRIDGLAGKTSGADGESAKITSGADGEFVDTVSGIYDKAFGIDEESVGAASGIEALESKTSVSDGKLAATRSRKGVILIAILSLLVIALASLTVYASLGKNNLENRVEELETTYSPVFLYLNTLTVARFEEKVASGEEFLAYISRPNCPFCRALDPSFVDFIEEMDLSEKIYYVNVAKIRETDAWIPFKEKYGFWYTPAFIHYSGGEVVSSIDDDVTPESLKAWLNENLS